nr:hypothetical protein [Actinomycetota bacterium]
MARDTGYENANAVQEKVLDAIRVGQEATLTAVRETAEAFTTALPKMPEWAEAFTNAMPKLPEWAEAYTPKLPDLSVLPSFESLIGFTEKVWESQREFNLKLYEAIAPIGKSAFGAAKDTAKVAKSAEPTKPVVEHSPPTR